jgi:hypothetical protein
MNTTFALPGMDGSKSKVQAFKNFIDNNEKILICTHATLRFAFEELDESQISTTCLLAIDEFHHVSCRRTTAVWANYSVA